MKKNDTELTRLKARFTVRERQIKAAIAGLKEIEQFQSAHLSVYFTEVQWLRSKALKTLCRLHELQEGKKLKLTPVVGRKYIHWFKLGSYIKRGVL